MTALSVDSILKSFKMDLPAQLTIVDAPAMAALYHPTFPPHVPALIVNLDAAITPKAKELLLLVYPADHQIHLSGSSETIQLQNLATAEPSNQSTSLFIPALAANSSLEEFQELIAHLRAPEGCPWDREQTHVSLRRNLIEETYEVIDALDAGDPKAMQEEFGDLLVQVLLHTQIASEAGEFRMADVLHGIITKLIARHPHVFGDLELKNAEDVIANWEHLKAGERKSRGDAERGLLDGVGEALPALSQAEAYTARAARVGFEWPNIEGVLGDVAEEIQEFRAEEAGSSEQEAEFGDILFALVNLSRWLKIDPEAALRAANRRFRRRFAYVETGARQQGRKLQDMTLEEMDKLWDEGKKQNLQ
jgi:tetrapyrrole methylase family protein/MazG family protein